MKAKRFIALLQDIVNFTNKLLAKVKLLQIQYKSVKEKILLVSYQLFILTYGIFLVCIHWNTNTIYLICSVILFIAILITSIPFTSMTILEFMPEHKSNLKNYSPKFINNSFIIEEYTYKKRINLKDSKIHPVGTDSVKEKVKPQMEIENDILENSFNELLTNIEKCEIFDSQKKKFDLTNQRVTRLQSMQILCLFFENNYETDSPREKKNRQKIFNLFNNYFNAPEMNQKNWKDYTDYIIFDDTFKNIDPYNLHDFKNYFYHHLTKTRVKF